MNPHLRSFHCYIHRHLFHGDSYIGMVDVRTKTVFLLPEFEALAERARGHVARMLSFPVKLEIGLGAMEAPPPLPMDFPAEVWEQREPGFGDLTPALVAYAREHFPAAEFRRRYLGRVDGLEAEQNNPPQAAGSPVSKTIARNAKARKR